MAIVQRNVCSISILSSHGQITCRENLVIVDKLWRFCGRCEAQIGAYTTCPYGLETTFVCKEKINE
jgi:hypothetical protein